MVSHSSIASKTLGSYRPMRQVNITRASGSIIHFRAIGAFPDTPTVIHWDQIRSSMAQGILFYNLFAASLYPNVQIDVSPGQSLLTNAPERR